MKQSDKNYKYYLCDCCKDTDNPDDDAIYNCKKCGKQICNGCVANLEVGEEIPCDDQQNIEYRYCPFCGTESNLKKMYPSWVHSEGRDNSGKRKV